MTLETIRQRLKKHYKDNNMQFVYSLIDIMSNAEIMELKKETRLNKVWKK